MKKFFLTDKNLINILAFLFGLTCTFCAFKFSLKGIYFYPSDFFYYSLIFFLTFFVLFRGRIKTPPPKKENILYSLLIFFFLIIVFSVFIPILDNASFEWVFVSLKASFKFIILTYFLVLLFLISDNLKLKFFSNFFKGFFISIIIHVIFSITQLITWYSFKIDLNKFIFLDMLGAESARTHFIIFPILRTSGLHWDPAYLGIWILIGTAWIWFFWKDNWIKKAILSLFGLIFIMTFSRTGVLALIMVLFLIFSSYLIRTLYKMEIKVKINKSIKVLSNIILIICIALGMSFYFIKGDDIYKIVQERTDLEIVSSQRHINYFNQGARAISSSIPRLLFGFGYRNGGRGLLETPGAVNFLPGIQNIKIPWSPESDFVNNYLELGLFGFVFYFLIFIFGTLCLKKINLEALKALKNKTLNHSNHTALKNKVFFFLACYGFLFFAGFGYAFKDGIWYWLLIISSTSVSLELKNKLLNI